MTQVERLLQSTIIKAHRFIYATLRALLVFSCILAPWHGKLAAAALLVRLPAAANPTALVPQALVVALHHQSFNYRQRWDTG